MEKNELELYDIDFQNECFNNLVKISEDFLQYISSYNYLTKEYAKSLQIIQNNYNEKIKATKIEVQNHLNIDFSNLFLIINSLPSINISYLENLNYFIKGMDNSITALQKYIEGKKVLISNCIENLNNSKNVLFRKINDIEKEKNIYFDNISYTEKIVSEFYSNKINIEEYSKNNDNENKENLTELKNLFIQKNFFEEQMDKSINDSMNLEKKYKLIIINSQILKKSFIDSSNKTYRNIESISKELFNEIKKSVQNIIIPLKNCYVFPLNEIDNVLSKLLMAKEEDNKILNNTFAKLDNKIDEKYPIILNKYSLQIFNKSNKPFMKIEDGLEEITCFSNDLYFYIAKTMYSYFTLIEEDYEINFQIEEQKLSTKNIISNILLNIEKKYKKSDLKQSSEIQEKKELKYVTEKDILLLYALLDKHYNRVIFLQTITQFRTSGKFCIPFTIFEIITKCFIIIINTVIRDEDYPSAKNAIILSQTYFYMNDNEQYYLLNYIKNHELFHDLRFWEKILEFSIKKDIIKNHKNLIVKKNKEVEVVDKKVNENEITQEISKEKLTEIAFGQIIFIVNNMIDFDINIKDIRSFFESKAELYKLNQYHKNNIELIIESTLNLNKEKDIKEVNKNEINNEI